MAKLQHNYRNYSAYATGSPAREIADRVIFMEKGRFVTEAPPDEFFGSCMTNSRVASFVDSII